MPNAKACWVFPERTRYLCDMRRQGVRPRLGLLKLVPYIEEPVAWGSHDAHDLQEQRPSEERKMMLRRCRARPHHHVLVPGAGRIAGLRCSQDEMIVLPRLRPNLAAGDQCPGARS